jgi:hypothetical protein
METWEKRLREFFHAKLPSPGEHWVESVIKIVKGMEKQIIQEFLAGKRCMNCGKLKEEGNDLADMCGECFEGA